MKKCPKCNYPRLSPLATRIYDYISEKIGSTFVEEIAMAFKLSQQAANNYCYLLYKQNLLEREKENIIGGGIRYKYFNPKP